MKKLVGLIATLLVVMSFVGCASNDVAQEESVQEVTSTSFPSKVVLVSEENDRIVYKCEVVIEEQKYNCMQVMKWVNQTLKSETYDFGTSNLWLGKSWGSADSDEYIVTITYQSDNYVTGYSNIGKGLAPYFFDFEVEFVDNECFVTFNNVSSGTMKSKMGSPLNYIKEDLLNLTDELFNRLK